MPHQSAPAADFSPADFRRYALPGDIEQAVFLARLLAVSAVGWIALDYLWLGITSAFFFRAFVRVAACLGAFGFVALVRRAPAPQDYDRLFLAGAGLLTGGALVLHAVDPGDTFYPLSADALLMFMFFFASSGKTALRALPGFLLGAGDVAIAFFRSELPPVGRSYLIFILLLAFAAGYWISNMMIARRRREFQLEIELRAAQNTLDRLAQTDQLTGTHTERYFLETAERTFQHFRRYARPFVLILAEIDGFASLNETYGPNVGDETLRIFGRALLAQRRADDQVGRLTENTFGIILPETNADQGMLFAERIRKTAETAFVLSGEEIVHFTISLGVTEVRPADGALAETRQRAEQALQEAKASSRNQAILKID